MVGRPRVQGRPLRNNDLFVWRRDREAVGIIKVDPLDGCLIVLLVVGESVWVLKRGIGGAWLWDWDAGKAEGEGGLVSLRFSCSVQGRVAWAQNVQACRISAEV
jgi:hypothetical protein